MSLDTVDGSGVIARNGCFFGQTFSGIDYNPYEFDATMDIVPDMLRGMAFNCRFAGQTEHFYSVAQHSIIMSYMAEDLATSEEDALNLAKQALLHDIEEGLTGDMIRPIKLKEPNFALMGDKIRAHIFKLHGLPEKMDARVKVLDNAILACEKRDLLPFSTDWPGLPEPDPIIIINPLSPNKALKAIMDRYTELFG